MTFDLWAIRHRPSGMFLPDGLGKSSRGASLQEPTNERPARLFRTEAAAKIALRMWLKGRFQRDTYQGSDGEYDERITVVPVPSRKADEMEVVRFKVTEAGR